MIQGYLNISYVNICATSVNSLKCVPKMSYTNATQRSNKSGNNLGQNNGVKYRCRATGFGIGLVSVHS